MRARVMYAFAGLLGVLAISYSISSAQEPKDGLRDASTERAKLKDDLIQARVEVGLMQLDADAERDSLLDLMKVERSLEANEVATTLLAGIPGANERNLKAALDIKKKTAEAYRPLIERKRKAYADQLKAIASDRLRVEDMERSYLSAK